jgi:anthranilate phosphoribosyltransferase
MTVTGATHIADGHDGQVTTSIITPEEVGLKTAPFATIRGGRTAAAAAEQVRAVLGGEPGPKLDMVLLNAGTTLMAAGLVPDIRTGIDRARETVRSGAALAKLDQLIAFCRA